MSFSDLLSMKYEGQGPCGDTCVPPTVTVTRTEQNPGHKFDISITNPSLVPLTVTVVVTLDYMLIAGTVNLPDTLTFIFCVDTDCGDVCVTNVDTIANLSPPLP